MAARERFKYGPVAFTKSDFAISVPFELEDVPFLCDIEALISLGPHDASDAVAITSVRHCKTGVQLYGYLRSECDYRHRPFIYSAYMNEARRGHEGDSFDAEIA